MPRSLARRTLLAAALFTGSCWGLLGMAQALAEELTDCPTCQTADGGVAAGVGGGLGTASCFAPNCRERQYGQPSLFYNYYVPGTCGGVPAELYLAPRPVPPMVGHTYYTYQPFLPHELLYQHNRRYYRNFDNGRGQVRTRVSWYNPPGANAMGSVLNHLRIAR